MQAGKTQKKSDGFAQGVRLVPSKHFLSQLHVRLPGAHQPL
jgi:hypothetical protein